MGLRLGYLVAASLGTFAGLGAFTFEYAQGLSYFSNDPSACANCHVMREFLDSWQKSPHHGRATCNDCHVPHGLLPKLLAKAQNGWNHSSRFTLQSFAEPIRITPANASRLEHNCVGCHEEMVSEIFAARSEHRAEDLHCVHCHAGIGHGPRR